MKHIYILLCTAMLGLTANAVMADVPAECPIVYTVEMDGGGTVYALSDNGKWAVGDAVNAQNSSHNGYATLINALTGEVHKLYKDVNDFTEMTARDVTDNGDVAGSYCNKPAIYRREQGRWQILPLPDPYEWVSLTGITPDGKYAVARVVTVDWNQRGYAWRIDGDNAELIELKGIDKVSRLELVTPDGKIYGYAGMTVEGGGWGFLYDIESETYVRTGSGAMSGVSPGSVSPNGRYMAGIGGGKVKIYDVTTGETTIRDDKTDSSLDVIFRNVGNDQTLYGCTQHDLMFRNTYIHVGNYWYDLRDLFTQRYGVDWHAEYAKDDYNHTGTFWAIDGDGKVMTTTDYVHHPRVSYIIRMPETFAEVCPGIDLLASYTAMPQSGASFARIQGVQIAFQREIEVVDNNDQCARLEDASGNVLVNSVSCKLLTGDTHTLSIVFRNYALEEGEKYYVVLPAGSVSLKGDTRMSNREIRLEYVGRPNVPVYPVKMYPEEGNMVPRINLSSNPVVVDFDTELSVCDNPTQEARIKLYIDNTDGDWELVTALNASVAGRQVKIYPVNEQRLADGANYKIVISAGTFGDLSGSCPNEEIEISYVGSYVPDPPSNDKVIFADDFSAGLSSLRWMFYEGDGNTPSADMYAWDFTADTTPWWFVRDNVGSTDWAACSHSSYYPAGKSDDWMVTTGLYISDDSYTLSFDSQSYLKSKEDRLKVIVWPSDDVITALTPSVVDKMRYTGTVVYNEIQSPGDDEETMAGEWRHNEVSLAEFAGKRIYIAFVNDNMDQSAVFLDNIEVSRDLKVAIEIFTPEYVTDVSDVEITGRFTVMADKDEFSDVTLSLTDASGNEIDRLVYSGKIYGVGDSEMFTFPVRMPLERGKQYNYKVIFKSSEVEASTSTVVKNMLFSPERRVVLEEYTGTTCQFCPQGLAVIEKLEKEYGEKFIPIAIHGYTGSQFANNITDDYSYFLGLSSAPSGVINRKWMSYPMSEGYKYLSASERLWYDIVTEELGLPADAEVNIASCYVDGDARTMKIDTRFRYAFDADNLNLGVLIVVLEDGLLGMQANGIYTSTSPDLGEWANGGKYASGSALYEYNDIMRGVQGTTFNGTGGYIPASVEGGKEYKAELSFNLPNSVYIPENTKAVVMLVDANTGLVVNAARAKATTSSVDNVGVNSPAIVCRGDRIEVSADGQFRVEIYSADGLLINGCIAVENASLELGSYHGIVVVRVMTDSSITVRKIMAK